MDNFRIDITSEGVTDFDQALQIAFAHAPGRKATHYQKDTGRGFLLFWNDEPGAIELPTPLRCAAAADLIWAWLEGEADYGQPPDHDGDNSKGWRVYNEDWGFAGDWRCCFVAVQPVWAMHGK